MGTGRPESTTVGGPKPKPKPKPKPIARQRPQDEISRMIVSSHLEQITYTSDDHLRGM